MSLPNLSMFDPNDVNNVKADPATFNSNEFVGSLNLTSAQLKTLIDAFETFTDTASYNVNGTALEIEKLQSQFNELHNICTNVCPKCINLATIQTQIATKNVQKKKELDQHRMLYVIKHMLEQKIKNAKDAELKAQTQQRARSQGHIHELLLRKLMPLPLCNPPPLPPLPPPFLAPEPIIALSAIYLDGVDLFDLTVQMPLDCVYFD